MPKLPQSANAHCNFGASHALRRSLSVIHSGTDLASRPGLTVLAWKHYILQRVTPPASRFAFFCVSMPLSAQAWVTSRLSLAASGGSL